MLLATGVASILNGHACKKGLSFIADGLDHTDFLNGPIIRNFDQRHQVVVLGVVAILGYRPTPGFYISVLFWVLWEKPVRVRFESFVVLADFCFP